MNAIEVREMTAGSGGLAPIQDLNLTVSAGQIVALLGANGSGKSTTVNAICGLESVERGSISLAGAIVTAAPARVRARRGLATVADERGVFAQLSVAENLRLGAPRRGGQLPVGDWFPALARLIDRRAGLLSGGEQTVLALARALMSRPRALVVDELTAGLGPGLVELALTALRRAAAEWGTGVLLVEQNARVGLEAADRVVVLCRGQVALEGASTDIASHPGVIEATYLGDGI